MKHPTKHSETIDQVSAKATEAEIKRRVVLVHKLLSAGYSRASIVQNGSKKWGISERQVDDYIAAARKTLTEQSEKEKDVQFAMALERMNFLFKKAVKSEDYQGAIAAQREINKIIGLYAPIQQNIDIHVTWQDEAVSLIKAGEITYEAALETFDHDDRLVRDLFAKAQVPISTGESEAD